MNSTEFFDEDEAAEALALDPQFADRFTDQRRPKCQLYLISPLDVTGDFPDRLSAALAAGPVAAFQFRVKSMDQHEAARLAEPLLAICRAADVAFIVNDDVGLAKRIGADGVHLGQDDGDPREARKILGPEAQIGITVHAQPPSRHGRGRRPGPIISPLVPSTPPPPNRPIIRRTPSIIGWWTTVSEIPCVAIGGITAENCAPIVAAGADFIAVSAGVWAAPDGAGAAVERIHTAMASPAALRRNSREKLTSLLAQTVTRLANLPRTR